jgi:hypothetical protein
MQFRPSNSQTCFSAPYSQTTFAYVDDSVSAGNLRFIPRKVQLHYLQVKTFPQSSYGILCHLSFPEQSRLQDLH